MTVPLKSLAGVSGGIARLLADDSLARSATPALWFMAPPDGPSSISAHLCCGAVPGAQAARRRRHQAQLMPGPPAPRPLGVLVALAVHIIG
jgi:hypothetical protein